MGILSDAVTKADDFVSGVNELSWAAEDAAKKGRGPMEYMDESGTVNRVPMEQSDEAGDDAYRMADMGSKKRTKAGVLAGKGLVGLLTTNPLALVAGTFVLMYALNYTVEYFA